MKTNYLFRCRVLWSVLVVLLCGSLDASAMQMAGVRGVLGAEGGTAAGGVYALTDTAGQPCVGTATSANYTVADGFWPDTSAATVELSNLSQIYDGTAKSVSVTTDPTNLAVSVTYNSLANAPTNAGSYNVVGTITDPSYYGGTTNTLVISQAAATVTLGSLSQTYTGSARSATATTTPTGLTVNFTYNGSANAPTNASSYTVIGTVSDANYTGSATNTLVIAPAAATVTLGNLSQIYDATAKSVSVTTDPTNLAVSVTYDGIASAPTNAGSYMVIAIVTDANYRGTNTATSQITPRALSVTGIRANDKVYDGTTNATLILTNAALAGNLDGINVVLNTTNATGAFADANVGTNKTVQVSGLTISGSAMNNYAFTQPTTNATITGKPLNLTANGDLKVYGHVRT
ncbi:MAG: MBG domain-containing protein, partial [Verrucomicrobiota bacterium]